MKASPVGMRVCAALAAFALAATGAAWAEEQEEKVSLDQVPKVVKETIIEHADMNSATVNSVTREIEDGQVTYEAEATRTDGGKLEIEVGEDGKLIEIESEDEEDEDDD